MTRRTSTKRVDRAHAATYLDKGRRFRADAATMAGFDGEFSGNGVAVLCVHAAIAYADALCIRAREVKSTSGEHLDAVDALESSIRIHGDADRSAVKSLRAILQRKDEVSYGSTLMRADDTPAEIVEDLRAALAAFEELQGALAER